MSQVPTAITPLTPLAADLISVATQMSLQAGDMSPDLVRLACDNIFDVAERVARMERAAIATLNPREA